MIRHSFLWQGGKDDQVPPITFENLLHILKKTGKE
jgi:hypothetical protein